jgi:hypothetical protein
VLLHLQLIENNPCCLLAPVFVNRTEIAELGQDMTALVLEKVAENFLHWDRFTFASATRTADPIVSSGDIPWEQILWRK